MREKSDLELKASPFSGWGCAPLEGRSFEGRCRPHTGKADNKCGQESVLQALTSQSAVAFPEQKRSGQ